MNDTAIPETPEIAIPASLEERPLRHQRMSGLPIVLQYRIYQVRMN